ncbi:uncharacterized protein BJ171DRAFT_596104 [Polychytrium aggregatum]|uniref:uncharacterized protein n=1 Tax=Polychytrium aggregatum TaxID=110093 RepID=UPI0022FDE7B2|nr:uncharacterized protein BJ171DRAFT_596104 [Polychytrium aggregatum]KAI9208322.1 hypothetical protein BJ171DRAFT_596104 [Polychytrium aggregatum]
MFALYRRSIGRLPTAALLRSPYTVACQFSSAAVSRSSLAEASPSQPLLSGDLSWISRFYGSLDSQNFRQAWANYSVLSSKGLGSLLSVNEFNQIMELLYSKTIGRPSTRHVLIRRVYEDLTRTHRPNLESYKHILFVCSVEGNVAEAEAVLSEMKRAKMPYEKDELIMTFLATTYARAGDAEKTNEYLKALRKRSLSIFHHNRIMGALAKSGNRQAATEFYNRMCNRRPYADRVTIQPLMTLAESESDYDAVVELFERMRQTLVPSEGAYASVLKAHIERGDLNSAVETLTRMEEQNFNKSSRIFALQLQVAQRLNEADLFWSTYAKIVEKGVSFSDSICGLVASQCGPVAQPEEFYAKIETIASSVDLPVSAELLGHLARGYVVNGDESSLQAVLELIKTKLPDEAASSQMLEVYNSLIATYCDQGKGDSAIQLFDRILASGLSPNAASYNTVLQHFATHGKGTEAEVWIDTMKGAGAAVDEIAQEVVIESLGFGHPATSKLLEYSTGSA